MNKNKIKEEDQVKLRPILGKPPTTYIPILYIAAIMILFFLLFMLPGIIKSGSYLIVNTNVDSSTVYVEDTYIGESDVPHYMKKGSYTLTVKKPYFSDMVIEDAKIPGNLFFSLFHRKKVEFSTELEIDDVSGYLSWRLEQIEKWAPIKAFSDTYFLPQIFTETAEDLVVTDSQSDSAVVPFFTYALAYLQSQEMKDDYDNGLSLLEDGIRSKITTSDAYISYSMDSATVAEGMIAEGSYSSRIVDDIYYLEVSGGMNLPLGLLGTDSSERSIDSFYISSIEVTEEMFARFLQDESDWKKDNIQNLIATGLVDEYYLDSIDMDSPSKRPIRNISYRAADAFCSWYEQELLQSGYSVEVSLPTEYEWETAALAYDANSSYAKQILIVNTSVPELFGMFGSLWEYTSSNYLFHHHYIDGGLLVTAKEELELPDNLITVKGGSYINDKIYSYSRGVSEASSCSPYTGFRLIIREK